MWKHRHKLKAFPSKEHLHGLFASSEYCCYFPGRKSTETEPPFYPTNNPWIAGCFHGTVCTPLVDLNDLKNQWEDTFLIGYFSYSLKNKLYDLTSSKAEWIKAPDLLFFNPDYLIRFENDGFYWLSNSLPEIPYIHAPKVSTHLSKPQNVSDYLSYKKGLNKILKAIQKGDIYEVNYCQAWQGNIVQADAFLLFDYLIREQVTPFSALFKAESLHILSLSPERFILKSGSKLVTQPIKGTRKRSKDDAEDSALKHQLESSFKDYSENIMVADLVRNDLSRYASKGSVKVEELARVYAFPHVHQMLSTIQCELQQEDLGLDALLNAFPMGSMTGVPKISAMKIIDEAEQFSRGLYSGSLGYFDGTGNYDFNVLIRSLFMDLKEKKYYLASGGAITCRSDTDEEYAESLLKSEPILQSLQGFVET